MLMVLCVGLVLQRGRPMTTHSRAARLRRTGPATSRRYFASFFELSLSSQNRQRRRSTIRHVSTQQDRPQQPLEAKPLRD